MHLKKENDEAHFLKLDNLSIKFYKIKVNKSVKIL